MNIRPAIEEDIPQIVRLLKLSLGESLMPKSEGFWRWKHVDNPFGESPVLLAWEGEQLIGVRAFMRWQWQRNGEVIKAVRAVDTATHPDHQGKGIFRTLTMKLVEQCKQEGVHFIFNTPNKISMPGYLKMGWQSRGKLPVRLKLHVIRKHVPKHTSLTSDWNLVASHPWWSMHESTSSMMQTALTPEYILWRYRDNPNVSYQLLESSGERPFMLIYRKKKMGLLTELRITDLLCLPADITFALRCLQGKEPGAIITMSGCNPEALPAFLSIKAGPIVTIRNLNLNGWEENLTFDHWSPSLGDLELF